MDKSLEALRKHLENMTEEEELEISEWFDEGNSLFELEEKGWQCDETSINIECDVTIEKDED